MKKNQFVQCIGFMSVASLLLISGCATQNSSSEPAAAEPVAIAPADDSSPTMPVASSPVVEVVEVVEKKPEPEPEVGSVASVLKKMESSPYTLYWREKDTYSYYVGGLFDAEYQPGKQLVVKEDSLDEKSLTCTYDNAGNLGTNSQDAKAKDACSELMFTLDSELSD